MGLAGFLDDVLEIDNYWRQVCGDSVQADVEVVTQLLADSLKESYHGVTVWSGPTVPDYQHWSGPWFSV